MELDGVFVAYRLTYSTPSDPRFINAERVGIDTWIANDGVFPHNTVVPLYVRVVGAAGDAKAEVLIRVTNSEGDEILSAPVTIDFEGRPLGVPEDWPLRGHHIFAVPVAFPDPGVYRLHVSCGAGRPFIQPLFARRP